MENRLGERSIESAEECRGIVHFKTTSHQPISPSNAATNRSPALLIVLFLYVNPSFLSRSRSSQSVTEIVRTKFASTDQPSTNPGVQQLRHPRKTSCSLHGKVRNHRSTFEIQEREHPALRDPIGNYMLLRDSS
jgi:hypothetical protein